MINKLRKKFISATAAALFLMIFLVMTAVNCIFIFQTNRMLNSRLDLIMSNPFSRLDDKHREFPHDIQTSPGQNLSDSHFAPNQGKTDFFVPHFDGKLRIQTDGCLMILSEDGAVKQIWQEASERYSEEELTSVAGGLVLKNTSQGWYQYFKFRRANRTGADGSPEIIIGLVNASPDLYSMTTVFLASVAIGIVSFLLVLLVLVFASGRAVKPIAESYAKQKQFVTDAGHELKTPLTVISANNELSRMIYGESEWFDSIDKQVAKMNGLVRNLITLAKMDEEVKPVFSSFNLSDAVYDTAKSFENMIHSQGRLLVIDIMDDITCTGDESTLRQVVSILVDNAAKYCDEQGKITVRLSRDKQIRLQVINDFSDAGACDLSRVFERFYRADKARASDGSYGLGLSIAKSIVELHKGKIRTKILEHDRVMFEVLLK